MIWVFFLHWLADFPFQTPWMATQKAVSRAALGAHVGVYSLVLLIGLVLSCPITHWSFWGILAVVAINAACHYVTDGITSKITNNLQKTGAIRQFWWVIGFDQFIHYVTLYGLIKICL
jgi:hypothetical protein